MDDCIVWTSFSVQPVKFRCKPSHRSVLPLRLPLQRYSSTYCRLNSLSVNRTRSPSPELALSLSLCHLTPSASDTARYPCHCTASTANNRPNGTTIAPLIFIITQRSSCPSGRGSSWSERKRFLKASRSDSSSLSFCHLHLFCVCVCALKIELITKRSEKGNLNDWSTRR